METGCKDHYFQHFIDMIQDVVNKLRIEYQRQLASLGKTKSQEIQEMLADLWTNLSSDIFNLILNMPCMLREDTVKLLMLMNILNSDSNQDSLVEILHVVLLRVVKY